MANENVILLTEYGSRAHGTHTEDSDHDLMGIYVEPMSAVLGLYHKDTIQKSTAVDGGRSMRGDTDTTLYPLRKWASLAAQGNPTVLTTLFTDGDSVQDVTMTGDWLRQDADAFISKEAGKRFLGYAKSQRDALTGMRNKRTNRPELVHKYGYDTKFAYHMVRLQLLGIELMQTGRMTLPMSPSDIAVLMAIRNGGWDKEELLAYSDMLDDWLKTEISASGLPDRPDYDRINGLLGCIYLEEWGI